MDYSAFTENDFAQDPEFQKWVLSPDDESDLRWKEFLNEFPERTPAVLKAREIVAALKIKEEFLSQDEKHVLFEDIKATLAHDVNDNHSDSKGIKYPAIAAILLILILAGSLFYFLRPAATLTYATRFGEKKEIQLPDGSKVSLNANSKMRFAESWDDNHLREVWLSGEAFFEVTPRPNGQKFKVYTRDLTVEVLGTAFNVSNSELNTEVVLSSGKIKLDLLNKPEEIFLAPGEMAIYKGDEKKLLRKEVEPEMYASWRNNIWIFENTPLDEIAEKIERTYGLDVIFKNPSTAQRKVTGTHPINDFNEFLQTLSASLDLVISKEQNAVIIKN